MIKCTKCFNEKAIIKLKYESILVDKIFCLDCLVDFLDNVRDNKHFHLIEQTTKIIPIYN